MQHLRFLSVFFILLGFVSILESTKVSGIVTDVDKKPLESVRLVSGKKTTLTRQNGSFTIEVMDSMQVSRLGYKKQTLSLKEISALPKDNRGIQIILQDEPIQLPTYYVFAYLGEENISAADVVTLPIDPDKNYNSASELISQTSSFQSTGTQLKGEIAEINILGNISRHTLVLVDGIA
ncbi:MAG: TonB-dependent receptor, partial [Candidatus Cloacimonetes bacterium]|nr:TonB-dependent receptor [Candidatus Cloacimonadota bacterium]